MPEQNFVNATYELGCLHYDRGDFETSIAKLSECSPVFLSEKKYDLVLECMNRLLQMYVELDQMHKVQALKETLQDLVLKEGFELSARTYYVLAFCEASRNQIDSALEYLNKSLSIALSLNDKKDICYAISGLAICYKNQGRHQEALKEIYNLQIFFEVLDIPIIKASNMILNGLILNELGKYDQASDVFWKSYELVKQTKNQLMHVKLLSHLATTAAKMGEKDLAFLYFNLSLNSCDEKNYIRTYKYIKSQLDELGQQNNEKYDLVFDFEDHLVTEKKLGRIDFKNQFVLLDLLKLFLNNQGRVYTKENLVESIWKQDYDPAVHDNKIYVTIKRLRKMIEPDYDKPKYIFRAKNGYYMNKTAKVMVSSKGGIQ